MRPPFSTVAPPAVPLISFGGGIPDPDSLPLEALAESAQRTLRQEGREALQYGGPLGYEGLRALLASHLGAYQGLPISRDNLMLTGGSSQALDCICDAFLDPGDTVIVEDPTFPGSLWTLRSHGARLEGVPLDDQGIRLDILEERLGEVEASAATTKFLYTIPSFHNPCGVTMGLERRQRLLQVVARHGLIVVEDDAYGELRYQGQHQPSLYSLDRRGMVIQMGTFSKIMAPGLRLGWAVGDPEAIALLARLRKDMGTSPFLCRVVADFMERGLLEPHIQKVKGIYTRKRDTALASLEELCSPWAAWSSPEGGFFLWLRLREGLDCRDLISKAYQQGVSYVPGDRFFLEGAGEDYLRLAFSALSHEEIEQGIQRLARAMGLARRL